MIIRMFMKAFSSAESRTAENKCCSQDDQSIQYTSADCNDHGIEPPFSKRNCGVVEQVIEVLKCQVLRERSSPHSSPALHGVL